MADPDIDALRDRILATPLQNTRRIIALAGAPASGKSTLARRLADRVPAAKVLPMDGFHLDNDTLRARGRFDRKGAPDTFDVDGLRAVLEAIRTQPDVPYPTFDRANDRVVPDADRITAKDRTIIVEGNYLLLTKEPWATLAPVWDMSVMLLIPMETLQQRLVQRWRDHGMPPDAAQNRAALNDLPNAQCVTQHSRPADATIGTG